MIHRTCEIYFDKKLLCFLGYIKYSAMSQPKKAQVNNVQKAHSKSSLDKKSLNNTEHYH